MEVRQYHVYLVNLDPTVGHEIKKTRPCVVISPDEMNCAIRTVIIAPLTSRSHKYPTRVQLSFQGTKGWIVLDQVRTIDQQRMIRELGRIGEPVIREVKKIIREMLVD